MVFGACIKKKVNDVKEYADMIINRAKSKNGLFDDMSAVVIKILDYKRANGDGVR